MYASVILLNDFIFFMWFRFNGQVDDIADPETTTHIIANGNCRDVLALKDACPSAHIVNIEWLDACISNGQRLDTNSYELWYAWSIRSDCDQIFLL